MKGPLLWADREPSRPGAYLAKAAKRILSVREEVRTGLVGRVSKRKEGGGNLSLKRQNRAVTYKKHQPWNWESWVRPLALPYPSNMTLGKSLNPFEVTLFTGL